MCRAVQSLDWEKPPLATTDDTLKSFVPLFDNVIVCVASTLPATAAGNVKLVEESVTCCAEADNRNMQIVTNSRALDFLKLTLNLNSGLVLRLTISKSREELVRLV